MKIALIGDVHGQLGWLLASLRVAKSSGADWVCQVGDLAMPWPGPGKYKQLDRLNLECERRNIDFLWIRGNHDDVDSLSALKPEPGEGFARMRERLWYLPDGARVEINGVVIGGLGGASSIDRPWRLQEEKRTGKPRRYYWPEEVVDRGAAARLALGGPGIDLLLTHEAPQPMFDEGHLQYRDVSHIAPQFSFDSRTDIELVTRVRAVVKPRLHVHGHHHVRVTSDDGSIIGLGRDGDRTGAMIMWDSDTGEVTDLAVKGA